MLYMNPANFIGIFVIHRYLELKLIVKVSFLTIFRVGTPWTRKMVRKEALATNCK